MALNQKGKNNFSHGQSQARRTRSSADGSRRKSLILNNVRVRLAEKKSKPNINESCFTPLSFLVRRSGIISGMRVQAGPVILAWYSALGVHKPYLEQTV